MSDSIQSGDRVHIYAARDYNRRGTVTEVRESDPLGRVTVQLDGTLETAAFHAADLEILPAAEP
jgi:hypothetical protein